MTTIGGLLKQQLVRECSLYARQLRVIVNACLFFMMIMVFFPLTMPSDRLLLRTLLPGLIWIAALFSMLLSSERLFQSDYDEGIIEQWIVSGHPISVFVAAKVWSHWLMTMMPLLFLCPVLAVLFSLNRNDLFALMASLFCGTPTLLFLCALAAAFGTGLRQTGILMALILLPLTIPVMIFGSQTGLSAMDGLPISGYLAWLLALSCLSASCLPIAIAGVIRVGLVD